jgi:hypothetical protein
MLLGLIMASTIVVALFVTPTRGTPSHSVIVASTTSSSVVGNKTALTVFLRFANGTQLSSGRMFLGNIPSNRTTTCGYGFYSVTPGTYPMNLTGEPTVFLPPTSIRVLSGSNVAVLTVYPLVVFSLYLSSSPGYNGSSPGPDLQVKNGTAVRVVITNNSTLIHDFAVVATVFNTSSSNVLFNSLSETMNAGGSTTDTFIVNSSGYFFYEDLIGSHARDGYYGFFIATP